MFTFPSNLPETRGAPPLSSFKAASRTSAVPPPDPPKYYLSRAGAGAQSAELDYTTRLAG